MIHLHDRAINETIAGIVTSRILRSLDKFFGSFESKIDIDVATEKLRLFPLLIHVTGAKHEDAGGLVRPLLLQFVLDNLAVEFGDRVPLRVAVVNHSIKVVQLAILLFCIETGDVLGCHQVSSQITTVISNLACGSWRNTYDVR